MYLIIKQENFKEIAERLEMCRKIIPKQHRGWLADLTIQLSRRMEQGQGRFLYSRSEYVELYHFYRNSS